MSIFVNWDNLAYNTLRLTFVEPWNIVQFEQASAKVNDYLNSVSHDVDLIIDLRRVQHIPEWMIAELRQAYSHENLNLRGYIFVGAPPELSPLMQVADHYYSALGGFLEFTFADDLNQARNLNLRS